MKSLKTPLATAKKTSKTTAKISKTAETAAPSQRRLQTLFAEGTLALPARSSGLWAWLGEHVAVSQRPHAALWQHEGRCWVLALAEDKRFQTDTVLLVLRQAGLTMLGYAHPVCRHEGRSEIWCLAEVVPPSAQVAANLPDLLVERLRLLDDAVADFPAMRETMHGLSSRLLAHNSQNEHRAFCQWLASDHFVFLGYREYRYAGGQKNRTVQAVAESGLGILRHRASSVAAPTLITSTGNLQAYLAESGPVVLSKTPDISPLHRAAPMDYIALMERDDKGQVVAEHRFLGLLTSSAYTEGVRTTPLLRKKVVRVLETSLKTEGWRRGSYNARVLQNVLETWPRDELFLVDVPLLARQAAAAVAVKAKPDTLLLLRLSARERAATALVYLPLARMSTGLRAAIGEMLGVAVGPVQEFKVELGEGDLARLMFRCRWEGVAVDEAALQQQIRQRVRGWDDEVQELLPPHAHPEASLLVNVSPTYRAQVAPGAAVQDAIQVVQMQAEEVPHARVRIDTTPQGLMVRSYTQRPLSLGQSVLLLESCGLAPQRQEHHQLGEISVQVLHTPHPATSMDDVRCTALERTLEACLNGVAETDALNRLALLLALMPQDILVLRALCALAQQLQRVLEPARSHQALAEHPQMAQQLLELFRLRLDPAAGEAARKRAKLLAASLEQAIQAIPSAEEELRWRTLVGVAQAALRTNVFALRPGEALAIKYDPSALESLPGPHPWREIFVYHPRVEGVHLRGGRVARGGLRHSNRATDYRTEVLGLMTAQMRKNTIIVPVGAKGGFFVRQAAPEGMSAKAWAEANYRLYIRALLSVTDTYNPQGAPVHPLGVACLDGSDPYLVVAADKGTATFSDTANAEACAADYWGLSQPGFWLNDAFASGGSAGYDHKALGITARGAWISLMHHAASLGIEPAATRPFTMVGIGDMAGDVFGNGLLRSPHIKLVAAFNHSHIFLDPNPDPARSFAERTRCFKAGLAWEGYETSAISAGGGVFPRNAKTIKLSPAAQKALGLKAKGNRALDVAPDDVLQAILAAPVDGLWNGGIGTYIKASDESHAAAQDKANDTTRIDAKQVRCAIIAEGGNLGITPRARVELAKRGVKLNTDALDNSAGVDTSDHEVNIKILLALAEREGSLTRSARNSLLESLTDDVCRLVLRDNAAQNLLISLTEQLSDDEHLELAAWQEVMIRADFADTAIDCLPSRKDLQARATPRYTRPELAALTAATKAWLRGQLMADGALLTSPVAAPLLQWYFPQALQGRFAAWLPQHPLAKEIVATELTNLIINRLGLLAVPRLMEDYGASASDAARALGLACCVARLTKLWDRLDELQESDAPLALAAHMAAYNRLKLVAGVLGSWLLRQGQPVNLEKWWGLLFGPFKQALKALPMALAGRPEIGHWRDEWQRMGVPEPLAGQLALLSPLVVVPDAVLAAESCKQPLVKVLELHVQTGTALQLPALMGKIRTMAVPDAFTRQAVQTLVMELFTRQRRLTEYLLTHKLDVAGWQADCGPVCGRYALLVRQLLREKNLTVAMLTLLLARLRELEV